MGSARAPLFKRVAHNMSDIIHFPGGEDTMSGTKRILNAMYLVSEALKEELEERNVSNTHPYSSVLMTLESVNSKLLHSMKLLDTEIHRRKGQCKH